MKSFFLLLVLFTYSFAKAGESLVFSEVIELNESTKEQLFSSARSWFIKFEKRFVTLKIADKETGELLGKGKIYCSSIINGVEIKTEVSYDINIYIKDGKYKYEALNFYAKFLGDHSAIPPIGFLKTDDENPNKSNYSLTSEMWKPTKECVDKNIKAILAILKSSMLIDSLTKDDW